MGKDVFEEHGLHRGVNDQGQVYLSFDCRFNDDIDRDSIKTWLRNQFRDHPIVKTWILSAQLSVHRCTHDDVIVKPCNETDYILEFQK